MGLRDIGRGNEQLKVQMMGKDGQTLQEEARMESHPTMKRTRLFQEEDKRVVVQEICLVLSP